MKEQLKSLIRRLSYRTPGLGGILIERQKLRIENQAMKSAGVIIPAKVELSEQDFQVRLHSPVKEPYSQRFDGILKKVRKEPAKFEASSPEARL